MLKNEKCKTDLHIPKNSTIFAAASKNISLYVPAQSVEAYKAADGWKDFKDNTYPIPDEAID